MSEQMLDRCPNCGEPLARQATFCYQCRWRRGDPLSPRNLSDSPPSAFDGPRSPPPAGSRVAAYADPVRTKPGPGMGRVVEPPEEVDPAPTEDVVAEVLPNREIELPQVQAEPTVAAVRPENFVAPQPDADDVELFSVDETEHPTFKSTRITPLGALVGIVVAVGLIAALAGAGARMLTRTKAEPITSQMDAKAVVGPAGGLLRFGGGSIVFPPGSVDRDREITVVRYAAGDVRGTPKGTDTLYAFGPSSVRFSSPIRIEFDLPDKTHPAAVYVVVDGESRRLPANPTDDGSRVTVTTRDFTFTETAS